MPLVERVPRDSGVRRRSTTRPPRLVLLLEARQSLQLRDDGTNFHMLLGFLIMRALLMLARGFSRLPRGASRGFARALNAGIRPFDVANYLGSWLGGTFLSSRSMNVLCDSTIAALHRRLDRERDLGRGMHPSDPMGPVLPGLHDTW